MPETLYFWLPLSGSLIMAIMFASILKEAIRSRQENQFFRSHPNCRLPQSKSVQ